MACEKCRAKRVRCDITSRPPCDNCRRLNELCIPCTSKPRGKIVRWTDQLNTFQVSTAGLVSYLGASSSLHLLVPTKDDTAVAVHYLLPRDDYDAEINPKFVDTLRQVDAFKLPPEPLRDELVGLFFEWVAPIIPVINKTQFMKRYRSLENPPSLLLQQAVLLAGSSVCNNGQLIDANSPAAPVGSAFYKRAKALYDASYESNQVIVTQALVLMGWYCAGDITQDTSHWTSLATKRAQSLGMHRKGTNISKNKKKLRKRIWWTLFTRDQSIAITQRRPALINTGDCDVELICEDDFIESGNGVSGNPLHIHFFLQYVKMCKITGRILSQCYSVDAKTQHEGPTQSAGTGDCDEALTEWLRNCPRELFWEETEHNFWSALLQGNYYTALCLLHHAHLPSADGIGAEKNSIWSRHIAFNAAAKITSIVDSLSTHNEMQYSPEFMVYSLLSVFDIYASKIPSNMRSGVQVIQERIGICTRAIRDLSRVWLVEKILKLKIESILCDEILQEPSRSENDGTKIIKQEADNRPEGPEKSEHDLTTLTFTTPAFDSYEICATGFMNTNQTQHLSLPSNPDPNSMPDILGPIHNPAYNLWTNTLAAQYNLPQPDNVDSQLQQNWLKGYNQAVLVFQDSGQISTEEDVYFSSRYI